MKTEPVLILKMQIRTQVSKDPFNCSRIMKSKSIIGIALFFLIFATISCNKSDGYSLGAFRIDIATVKKIDNYSYSLILDNGKKLWIAASDVRYIPKDNQRVFINYTLLSDEVGDYDHYIKLNDIWNILTKDIIDLTTENADSIGHDPVNINDIWIGRDFLNIDFMFNYGGVRPHAINLVKNTATFDENAEVIELEFRHNAYESQNTRRIEGLACFNLKPLQREDIDSVKISVLVKDWDGNKTYNVVYKYNSEVENATRYETPVVVVSSEEYY